MALALGRSIREVEQFDSADITEWMAFDRVEPIGAMGDDYRTGLVCSTLANIHKGSKVSKAYAPLDFMPFFKRPEPPVNALTQFRNWFGNRITKA